jgi:hypothetical protein
MDNQLAACDGAPTGLRGCELWTSQPGHGRWHLQGKGKETWSQDRKLAFCRARQGTPFCPDRSGSPRSAESGDSCDVIGCGLRRVKIVGVKIEDVQLREDHGVLADLAGKGGHMRTVPSQNG